MKNKTKQILPFIIMIAFILMIGSYFIYQNIRNDKNITNITTTNDINTEIDTDDGDEDVNWSNYQEYNLTNDDTEIEKGGVYNLSGTFNKGITINTTDNVKLNLNNVDIKVSEGAAIVAGEVDNLLIYLPDGTINTIEDSSIYSYSDEDIDGAIYSKDDMIFDGTGTLNITSNYQDAIVSKDDLKIINGSFNITSNDDGIRGKDSIYIQDGSFKINAAGDGIKSTNDTETDKGYILIEDGSFDIETELDAMQAETKLIINNGDFNIKTGGGSSNSSTTDSWGTWGRGPQKKTTTAISSAKGLKSVSNLVIYNGTFNFNTSDDAIHSNDYVGISNGKINITSGDDGIHADTIVIIDGGSINITKSYEGIESANITINNGDFNIISSDDGINIAGGNDSSGVNRPGENNYNESSNNKLIINNGTIYVNATGDGIDVNGSAYIYGGKVSVDGPTDNGNGILDYDKEFVMDGGTLLASGSNGMLQSITSTKQYNVTISFESTYDAKSRVSIVDSNKKEIISYTPSKKFSSLIISSSLLEKNQDYTIKINGTTYKTFKTSSLSNTVGNMGGGMMPNGGGKPGRR